ncbi:MAG: phasin family protein [Chloroflexota bacterium]
MATKAIEVHEEPVEEVEHSPLYEATRKVLLAAVGAVALAQEEIEDFVDKLVERGEVAEKDGRKLIKDTIEKRKKSAEKAEDKLDKRIEELLDRMNVPTKADIEALSAKITTLSKKVDELKMIRKVEEIAKPKSVTAA